MTQRLKRRGVPRLHDVAHVHQPDFVMAWRFRHLAARRDTQEQLVHIKIVVHSSAAEGRLTSERIGSVLQLVTELRMRVRLTAQPVR